MTSRLRICLPLLLGIVALTFFPASASGSYPIAKDGKIYACFKTKGKGKGTIRVIRSRKVRCPRKWRKMAWNATVRPGPQGAPGATGAAGAQGERGAPGAAGNLVVEGLEDKVSELLTRVEALEGALANLAGLEAVVGSLCTQTETLTDQLIPLLPVLSSYSCPTL